MIAEGHGDLLKADVDALVNTVNTVGVMGKGIALQFKRAYPAMFRSYATAARAGEIRLGTMHVWPTEQLHGPKYVINFPTKAHWRAKSRLRDIEAGLEDLVAVIRALGIKSIALPPLGCGNGGLEWSQVDLAIRRAFAGWPEIDVFIYPPGWAPEAREMINRTDRPTMTAGRAAFIALLGAYTDMALESPSLIAAQKLAYFLQECGEPLRLDFVKHRYGPYADNLRHVLVRLEGHYISGFGDGSRAVTEAEPLILLPGAEAEARDELREHPASERRIGAVMALIDGFESSYGLELLATVHWVARENPGATVDPEQAQHDVRAWSQRKGGLFTPDHIRTAWEALQEQGWLAPQVARA